MAYDPTQPLGPGNIPDWLASLLNDFGNQQPDVGYQAAFGSLLNGPNRRLADYLRGQQGNIYQAYLGNLLTNPTSQWQDYLKTVDPAKQFQMLSPRERGISYSTFAAPVKFLGRQAI